MSDNDARHQSLAELHERRKQGKQVIRLHKRKFGVMQIVELTGLSWPAVRTAIDLYEAGGLAAIKPKERSKKSGEGRKLSADQETKKDYSCALGLKSGHLAVSPDPAHRHR